jgi:glycosyltransferase involved in cell wall biosynthesis
MCRKRICILVFSNIARDGRVLRHIEFARREYDVDVIAYGTWTAPENVNFFQLTNPDPSSLVSNVLRLAYLAAGRVHPFFFERAFWRQPEHKQALEILKKGRYDLIHANDWNSLPVASAAKSSKTCVLFDAHEYTPGQLTQHFTGRYFKSPYYDYMLRRYSANIDGIITVSEGIADLYQSNFGWNANVVRNAPRYVLVDTHPVNAASIRLVHHGSAMRKRQLESLIELVSLLDDRFHLTFILVPTDETYLSELKIMANRLTPGRITFLDPIHPAMLPRELAAYDIGVHLLTDVNLNHQYALPNKLFDFIMAGLGVAVFPLPEMGKIVNDNQIGLISADQSLSSMARALNSLSPHQINEFKKNSLTLAKTLNGDVEMQKLMDIYAGLLSA